MKLHFEEEDLSERQECSALTSNLRDSPELCHGQEAISA